MKDKANKGYWQRLAKIYAPLMESDKKFYNAICGYIRDYLKSDMNVLDKTTPRLIQFHTLKNAVNPPFLGGFLISGTVAA